MPTYLATFNLDAVMQVRTEDGKLLGTVPRAEDGLENIIDSTGKPHPIRVIGLPAVCIGSFEGFKLADLPGFERFEGAPSDAELSRSYTGKDTDIGQAD
jgi:hypothetical protein